MKNRTLPYGYQCCNGITVLHPQESEIVKRICEAYLNGQSLLTIATWLNEEQIEYMTGVIGWNKARLKRIIEDERYIGKEPYPTILDEETHTAMQQIKEKRNTQKNTDRKADIFQISVPIKCPNCGKRLIRKVNNQCKIPQRWICENKDCRLLIAIADSDLLKAVSSTLAGITPESIRITEPNNNEPSIEVRRLNNDISRMLGAPQIDKNALRKKMMECISQKYSNLDADTHTARKLQADFERASTEDYKKTLNRTVSEIILYTDQTVGIILLNGQLIRKEQIYGTSNNG